MTRIYTSSDANYSALPMIPNWDAPIDDTDDIRVAMFFGQSDPAYAFKNYAPGGGCTFTASITSNVMTVSAVAAGSLVVGQTIYSGADRICTITELGTGEGGTGTYTVSDTSDLSSTALTGQSDPVVTGSPQRIDALFHRFNYANYLTHMATRAPAMTVLALVRDGQAADATSRFGYIAANSRTNVDGGRRGCECYRTYSTSVGAFQTAINGTSGAGAVTSAATSVSNQETDANFLVHELTSSTGTTAMTATRKLSPVTGSGGPSSNGSAVAGKFAVQTDEAAWPLLTGRTWRDDVTWGTSYGIFIDIGFLMVVNRILTEDERNAVYASVQTRAASLGVTI